MPRKKQSKKKQPYSPQRKTYTSLTVLALEMTNAGILIDSFDGVYIEANGYRYGMCDSVISIEEKA